MKTYRAGIVAIAKDEHPYLLEWLAYHLAIGFDHIWIYDNASETPLSQIVSRSAARKHVTFLRWPNVASGRTQVAAYNHFLRRFGRYVTWAAVIDLDEMICLKNDRTITGFLKHFDGANGIALNWRFFGSAGHRTHEPGLMIERFCKAAPVEAWINEGVKSFHKLDAVAFLMPHHAIYRDREAVVSASGSPVLNDWRISIRPENFAIAQINHYFVKSAEEWALKIKRHKSYSSDDREGYFERLDRNEVEDTAILAHLDATQAWMHQLERRHSGWNRLLDLIAAAVDSCSRVIGDLAGMRSIVSRPPRRED